MKWGRNTIKALLENSSYFGARVYNRNSMSKIRARQTGRDLRKGVQYPHWRNDPAEWRTIDAAHDPIVSRAIWESANSARRPWLAQTKPKHESQYLLTGLVFCSRCGFPFQGQSSGAKGRRYPRYTCGGYNSKRVCEYCAIDKEDLERFVLDSIHKTLGDPVVRRTIDKKLRTMLDFDPRRMKGEVSHIQAQLENVTSKIQRYSLAIEKGVDIEFVKDRLAELSGEKKDFLRRKAELEVSGSQKALIVDIAESVSEFLDGFEANLATLPMHEKKELIRKCVKHIEIDRTGEVIRCYVRTIPNAHPKLEELERVPYKTQTAPRFGVRLRNVGVAGTGPRTNTVRDFGPAGAGPQLELTVLSSQLRKNENAPDKPERFRFCSGDRT
jgi:hypothetical protein